MCGEEERRTIIEKKRTYLTFFSSVTAYSVLTATSFAWSPRRSSRFRFFCSWETPASDYHIRDVRHSTATYAWARWRKLEKHEKLFFIQLSQNICLSSTYLIAEHNTDIYGNEQQQHALFCLFHDFNCLRSVWINVTWFWANALDFFVFLRKTSGLNWKIV